MKDIILIVYFNKMLCCKIHSLIINVRDNEIKR